MWAGPSKARRPRQPSARHVQWKQALRIPAVPRIPRVASIATLARVRSPAEVTQVVTAFALTDMRTGLPMGDGPTPAPSVLPALPVLREFLVANAPAKSAARVEPRLRTVQALAAALRIGAISPAKRPTTRRVSLPSLASSGQPPAGTIPVAPADALAVTPILRRRRPAAALAKAIQVEVVERLVKTLLRTLGSTSCVRQPAGLRASRLSDAPVRRGAVRLVVVAILSTPP